jgi:hypothetical protein
MNNIPLLVSLIAVPLGLMASCGGGGIAEPVEIPFAVIESTSSGITTARFVVVKDNAAWGALWREHKLNLTPTPAVPPIDFGQQMVVAVFVGQRPSGCDSVAIKAVKQTATKLMVEYKESDPPPAGLNCTAALVFPAELASTAKSDSPVEFVAVK